MAFLLMVGCHSNRVSFVFCADRNTGVITSSNVTASRQRKLIMFFVFVFDKKKKLAQYMVTM
jgi:hypothetical protein